VLFDRRPSSLLPCCLRSQERQAVVEGGRDLAWMHARARVQRLDRPRGHGGHAVRLLDGAAMTRRERWAIALAVFCTLSSAHGLWIIRHQSRSIRRLADAVEVLSARCRPVHVGRFEAM
jgi:hypothetical protein